MDFSPCSSGVPCAHRGPGPEDSPMWVGGRQLSEDGAPPCPSEGRSRGGWQRREAASRTVVRVRACPGQHVAHWASRRRGGSEPSPLDGGRRARAAPGPPPGARPRASASRAPATTRNLEPVLRPAAEWTGLGRRSAMRLIMFNTSWESARPTTCPQAPRAPTCPRALCAPMRPTARVPCLFLVPQDRTTPAEPLATHVRGGRGRHLP